MTLNENGQVSGLFNIHDVVFLSFAPLSSLPTASTQTHDKGLAVGTRSKRKNCVDGETQRRAKMRRGGAGRPKVIELTEVIRGVV